MCGIANVVGVIGADQRKKDSVGITAVSGLGATAETFKRAIPVADFIDMKQFTSTVSGYLSGIIGHNRWSTVGSSITTNAHPFTVGKIHGVHNGTLRSQWKLPDHLDYDVDSENIMHSIDKQGIEKTWKNVDGAAALMWWDSEDRTFNMIRNDERPIYFCYSKDLKQMYAASEKFMLLAALYRNGIEHYQVEKLPVDKLYSFAVNLASKTPKEVVKCTTKKLVGCPITTYSRGGGVVYSNNSWSNNTLKAVTKGHLIGDTVDFEVVDRDDSGYGMFFVLKDNESEEEYHMECYTTMIDWLEEGDLAKGRIGSRYGNKLMIVPSSITDTSEYEFEIEPIEGIKVEELDEEEVDDAVWDDLSAQVELGELQAGDTTGEECAWCRSPFLVGEDVKRTTDSDVFCSDCADLADVAGYVTFINETKELAVA